MPQPLLSSQRLLMFVAGVLLINSQLTMTVTQAPARWARVAIDTVLGPVRAPLHTLALNLRYEPTQLPGMDEDLDLQAEYQLALIEIDRLKLKNSKLQKTIDDLALITSNDESRKTKPILTRVNHVSRTLNGPILHLEGGSSFGISSGMTVVWGTTAIGRVISPIGPATSEVQLITAQEANLQAVLKHSLDAAGSAVGMEQRLRIKPGDDKLSFIADVELDMAVSVGDVVLLADELQYTDALGWPVGRVTAITEYTPDPLMRKRLIIRPDIDPRQLPEVAVLVPEEF